MNRIIIAIIAVVVLGAGGFFLMQNNNKNSEVTKPKTAVATTKTAPLTFETIQDEIKNGEKLYDVRTPDEFTAGHFANAENFPLQDLQAGKLPDVAKTTKIYVHCRTGVRSAEAAKILRENGFANVVDLHGLADIEKIGGELIK